MSALRTALEHAARGWYVFPCKPDKRPCWSEHDLPNGKDNATRAPEQIRTWWLRWPEALIGLYCKRSGFFALDVDVKDGRGGWKSLTELQQASGGADLVVGPIQRTPSGGAHLLFRLPTELEIPNNANKLAPGLDLRSNGYICTGAGYQWLPGHGPGVTLTAAPGWLLDLIQALHPAAPHPEHSQNRAVGDSRQAGAYWLAYYLERAYVGQRNELGFALACQLRDSGLTEGEAQGLMHTYAERAPGEGYSVREARASLQQAYRSTRRTPAHLPGISCNGTQPQETDSDWSEVLESPNSMDHETNPFASAGQPTPGFFKTDDIGNGERLARRHGHRLRYLKEWGWLVWNGKVWERDRGAVAQMSKETVRSILAEAAVANDEETSKALVKHAHASANQARREAMIANCSSVPIVMARPEDFDADPWLLNVANGILDLQTGRLYPHAPERLLSKFTNVPYDPTAQCPLWTDTFLGRLFNPELAAFLRRAVGYSLTGEVSEQVLFFMHGVGANGKSTFLQVILAVLGDYGKQAAPQILMAGDRHPTEIADLQGARFAATIEVEEGRHLAEVLLKQLTGGDKLKARWMRMDFFEFQPAFKLWLAANHNPSIRGTDYAIWRRIKKIPFDFVIPESERDPHMGEKLKGELPGILAWAVRGCLEWQQVGLSYPGAVEEATAAYRLAEDTLQNFLHECCTTEQNCQVNASDLWKAYQTWGGDLKYQRQFSRAMSERGYKTMGRDRVGRALYHGLGLLSPLAAEATEATEAISS